MKGGKNQEGYADPTATIAVGKVTREQTEFEIQESERRVNELIKVLKYTVRVAGFELTDRIQLKDIRTGRVYK